MSTSKEKSYAAALKFQQKGQLDKAIGELERLVQDDPADMRTLLKIGDLQVRRQDNQAAVATYIRVARAYQSQGFSLKAVAVYKQVVHLDPGHAQAVGELADLYEKLGLISDAVTQQQQLLEAQKRQTLWTEAVGTLRRLIALSGETQDLMLQWAEAHLALQDKPEAKRTLTRVAEACLSQGRADDWAHVAEDLLQVDPELAGLACDLARHYMNKEQPKQALLKLQVAFRAAPQDTDTLTLLAQVFEALHQIPKAVAVLHELGEQAHQRGQALALERIAKHIIKLDPDDRQGQMWLLAPGAAKAQATKQLQASPPLPNAARGHAASPKPISKVDITNLLIEASVFERYGLCGRADEYLGRVLLAFPDNPQALELQRKLQSAREAAGPQQPGPRGADVDQERAHPIQSAPEDAEPRPRDSAPRSASMLEADGPAPTFFDPTPEPGPPLVGPKTDSSAPISHVHVSEEGEEPIILLDFDAEDDDPQRGRGLQASLDELIAEEVQHAQMDPSGPTRLDEHFDHVLLQHKNDAPHQEPGAPSAATDHDTQFNLGIAYKEMGLMTDAHNVFVKLYEVQGYAVSARAMAALCLLESGAHQEGQKLIGDALNIPEATNQERAALYYDLAVSMLAQGDDARAQEAFGQSAAELPGFRDAAARHIHPHEASSP